MSEASVCERTESTASKPQDCKIHLTVCCQTPHSTDMSDTPRTDAIKSNIDIAMNADTREQSIAHREEAHREIEQLERELKASQEREVVYRAALKSIQLGYPDGWANTLSTKVLHDFPAPPCIPLEDVKPLIEALNYSRARLGAPECNVG